MKSPNDKIILYYNIGSVNGPSLPRVILIWNNLDKEKIKAHSYIWTGRSS